MAIRKIPQLVRTAAIGPGGILAQFKNAVEINWITARVEIPTVNQAGSGSMTQSASWKVTWC